jgi:hypothetical protein
MITLDELTPDDLPPYGLTPDEIRDIEETADARFLVEHLAGPVLTGQTAQELWRDLSITYSSPRRLALFLKESQRYNEKDRYER